MGVVKLADYRHNPVQHQEASSMGYVSIHRQFMDSRLYKDSQAVHLWLHLILKANHESTVVNTDIGPITVDRGQMITGRPSLVRETFIPDNKVRSLLRTFESKGMLNICSMGKKFSLFTIVKYDDFQAKNCPTVVQQLSNANTSNGAALSGDCPTVVQRLSINNNINNISNTDVLESATADKKSDKKKPSVSCQDVVDAYHEILPEAPRIRALNDKRKNQIRTFWRKAGVITRQLDGHGFSMQDWRNYLSYVGENCRWMTEATELLYSRNGMTATQKYEAIQSIFTQLTDHAKTGSRRGLRSFGEVMEDWVSDLEKRFDPSGEQRGMSTGIPSLDRMLSPKGLVKGSLFVIGARPKMGKTTLYSQMAINCAVHEKKPALMFSLEMPGDQILEKLVGQKSGVNPNIFYLPATNDADDGYQGDYDGDFNRAIETANRLSEIDLLYIDDTPGLSLAQIVSESRRIKREKGCVGMILVDYLTLMTAEKADRNDLAYGMITKGLKNLAKELDCVVVLLTQLNRALESRTNKRPLPSDSRDTGQIEQDCDYWVGIHREGAFDDSVPPGETELILRLNRHGNTGTVYCIQANGAIYDTDQQSAEMRRREREEPQSKKKGGF